MGCKAPTRDQFALTEIGLRAGQIWLERSAAHAEAAIGDAVAVGAGLIQEIRRIIALVIGFKVPLEVRPRRRQEPDGLADTPIVRPIQSLARRQIVDVAVIGVPVYRRVG